MRHFVDEKVDTVCRLLSGASHGRGQRRPREERDSIRDSDGINPSGARGITRLLMVAPGPTFNLSVLFLLFLRI